MFKGKIQALIYSKIESIQGPSIAVVILIHQNLILSKINNNNNLKMIVTVEVMMMNKNLLKDLVLRATKSKMMNYLKYNSYNKKNSLLKIILA